jgi:hypothetical protein
MAGATKQGKVPEGSDDESIDLSAGFIPKTTPEGIDFQPEVPVATDGSEAGPIDERPTEITWRWCTERDMPALQRLHFQAEIAAGRELYLPQLFFKGGDRPVIAVAEKNGQIIGGVIGEDSITTTLIGMDAEVLESAGEIIIPVLVEKGARPLGIRLLHCLLPVPLADLGGALQKAGFKRAEPESVYQMELKAEDSSDTKRKNQ